MTLTFDLNGGADGVDQVVDYVENQGNLLVFPDAVIDADDGNWITRLEVTLVTPEGPFEFTYPADVKLSPTATVSIQQSFFTGLIPEFTDNGFILTAVPFTATSVWQDA